MTKEIDYKYFETVDIRVGTIVEATLYKKLKKPSIILKIDFGTYGIKKSSAQLISNYKIEDLINKQIAAVMNFPKKQIGDIMSEVLVLGFPDENNQPILVSPDKKVDNGGKLY